jgi:hypothetical protein
MPALAAKAKKPTRAELCRGLLEIERDHEALFTRIAAVKTALKLIAASDGKFRETFAGLGYVSVSPATPGQVTGEAPVLQVAAWQGLKPSRRDALLEQGLVKVEPTVKGAYHGRVDVKLHAT